MLSDVFHFSHQPAVIDKRPWLVVGGPSISTLLGLGLYSLVGWAWLDPVAGFIIAAFAIQEGREAWEGQLVEDDDDEDEDEDQG